MKKGIFTLTISLVLALLMLPVTAFADVFTESPEQFEATTVTNATFTGANATGGELILTPYNQKDTLPEDLHQEMDAAAESIRNATSVTELAQGVEALAREAGVADMSTLAVSDLFDLRATTDDWETVTVTLQRKESEKFVGLLHYTGNGWEIVDNAKENNGVLTFTAKDFSPFAVVVNTSKVVSPQTGDIFPTVILSAAVLFGAAGICFLLKSRRNSAV